jgi:hypothetical protein
LFNPTKAHEKEIRKGQFKIRMGGRVPDGAVNLAYSYVTPLNPNENVQIADTSGFILENVASNSIMDMQLWPDETHLLSNLQGQSDIYSQTFLLTNVFKDDVPLYFSYRLQYLHYDAQGPDANGYYQGKAIIVINKSGERLSGDKKVHILLDETDQPNLYRVDIYTSFQIKPGEEFKVIYNAVDFNASGEQTILTGYSERLNPQTAFGPMHDIYTVTNPANVEETIYYRANNADFGYSRVYVPSKPTADNRDHVPFQYRITAEVPVFGGTLEIKSPWIGSMVLNADSLTIEDAEYVNGFKKLSDMSAEELLMHYHAGTNNVVLLNTTAAEYRVECSRSDVDVDVKPDGKEPVLARTFNDTGKLILPLHYRMTRRNLDVEFIVDIYLRNKATGEEHLAVIAGPYRMEKENGEIDIKTINYAEWIYPADYDVNNYELLVRTSNPDVPVTISLWDRNTGEGYGSHPVPCSKFSYTSKIAISAKVEETRTQYAPMFSIRPTDNAQIKVMNPIAKGSKENWFLRIKNGRFYRSYLDVNNTPQGYGYFLPEYYTQSYDDVYGIPYRFVKAEAPQVVAERQIKLRYTPLFIKVDKNTNLPENITVKVNDIVTEVKAWDAAEGIVELAATVRESDKIEVDYFYQENAYEYRGFYDEENKRFWYLDLNPGKGHFSTQYDKEADEIKDLPSFGLINQTVYIYMRPAGNMTNIVQVLAETVELNLSNQYSLDFTALKLFEPRVYLKRSDIDIPHASVASPTETSWDYVGDGYTFNTIKINNPQHYADDYYAIDYSYTSNRYRFINGTYQKDVIFHTFEELTNEPNTLLLAKIQVRPNSAKDGIKLVDTRSRGGGLRETIGKALMKELMPESSSYWDIGFWDGSPYPENGVIVVRLPRYILKEFGGRLTKEEVEAAVEKHIAFGVFYIIEFLEEPLALLEIPDNLVTEIVDLPETTERELRAPEFRLITEG